VWKNEVSERLERMSERERERERERKREREREDREKRKREKENIMPRRSNCDCFSGVAMHCMSDVDFV